MKCHVNFVKFVFFFQGCSGQKFPEQSVWTELKAVFPSRQTKLLAPRLWPAGHVDVSSDWKNTPERWVLTENTGPHLRTALHGEGVKTSSVCGQCCCLKTQEIFFHHRCLADGGWALHRADCTPVVVPVWVEWAYFQIPCISNKTPKHTQAMKVAQPEKKCGGLAPKT